MVGRKVKAFYHLKLLRTGGQGPLTIPHPSPPPEAVICQECGTAGSDRGGPASEKGSRLCQLSFPTTVPNYD